MFIVAEYAALKRDNLQSLDKALDLFIAFIFVRAIFDFCLLNRRKKCNVVTYNIVSVKTPVNIQEKQVF